MNEICSLWACSGDSGYSDRKNYTIYRKRRLLIVINKRKKGKKSEFWLLFESDFDFFFLDFAWKINIIELGLDESLSLRDFLY